MPVSSYVVRYTETDKDLVIEQLKTCKGLSIGFTAAHGIAVAVETDTCREASVFGERLAGLRGVVDAVLVYHNFEDVSDAGSWKETEPEFATTLN